VGEGHFLYLLGEEGKGTEGGVLLWDREGVLLSFPSFPEKAATPLGLLLCPLPSPPPTLLLFLMSFLYRGRICSHHV